MARRTKSRLAAAIVGTLLLAIVATPAFAGPEDAAAQSHKAPEVPVALLMPLAGGLALGARIILAKKR